MALNPSNSPMQTATRPASNSPMQNAVTSANLAVQNSFSIERKKYGMYRALQRQVPPGQRITLRKIMRNNPADPDNPINGAFQDLQYDYNFNISIPEILDKYPNGPNTTKGSGITNPRAGDHYETSKTNTPAGIFRARSRYRQQTVALNLADIVNDTNGIVGTFLGANSGFNADTTVAELVIDVSAEIMGNSYSGWSNTFKQDMLNDMLGTRDNVDARVPEVLATRFTPFDVTPDDVSLMGEFYNNMAEKYWGVIQGQYSTVDDSYDSRKATVRVYFYNYIMRLLLSAVGRVMYHVQIGITAGLFSPSSEFVSLELKNPGLSGYGTPVNKYVDDIVANIKKFNYDDKYDVTYVDALKATKRAQNIVYANGALSPTDTGTNLIPFTFAQLKKMYALHIKQRRTLIDNVPAKRPILVVNNTGLMQLTDDLVATYPDSLYPYRISGVPSGEFIQGIYDLAANGTFGGGSLMNFNFKGVYCDIMVVPDVVYNDALYVPSGSINLLESSTSSTYRFGTLSTALAAAVPDIGGTSTDPATATNHKICLAMLLSPENLVIGMSAEVEMVDKKAPNEMKLVYDFRHIFIGFGGTARIVRTRGNIVGEFDAGTEYRTEGSLDIANELVQY